MAGVCRLMRTVVAGIAAAVLGAAAVVCYWLWRPNGEG